MGGKESGLPGRKLLLPHACRGATLLGLGGVLCNREHVPRCTRVLYPLVPGRLDRSTTPGTRVPAFCTRVPRFSYTLQTTRCKQTQTSNVLVLALSSRGIVLIGTPHSHVPHGSSRSLQMCFMPQAGHRIV